MSEDAGEADKDNPEDSCVVLRISWQYEQQLNVFRSLLAGFVMAIRDPVVLLFAVTSICQFLGQSFANFFPTCVDNPSICKNIMNSHFVD